MLVFLCLLGIYAYINLPKEDYPTVERNEIDIRGKYSGTNPSTLNSIVVSPIEEELDKIKEVDNIYSYIKHGSFEIEAELKENIDINEVLDKVKDAINTASSNFPNDMKTPKAEIVKRNRTLMDISISSNTYSYEELINIAKVIKPRIAKIKGIGNIRIYGDSELKILFEIDLAKLKAYSIDIQDVTNALKKSSNIFPVGTVKQNKKTIYINSSQDKVDKKLWENTIINVKDKKIYLKDIAKTKIEYPRDDKSISRFNLKKNIIMVIYKEENTNTIKTSNTLKKLIKDIESEYKGLDLEMTRDRSKRIKTNLNTVFGSIFFGMFLVVVSMFFLINSRIAILIFMGIPFSFLISAYIFYMLGYTITLVSLTGVLICIGIVVDDAVVVAENIQRLLDEGLDKTKAVIEGTKQMFIPVSIASLTTIFAFLPISLSLEGHLGLLMSIIPIVVTIVVSASLIESFIFLPLHAKHILKTNIKTLNWEPIYKAYGNLLAKLLKFKKTFLSFFIISIIIITSLSYKNIKFRLFPDVDRSDIKVSGFLPDNYELSSTDKITKKFEEKLKSLKDDLYIKNISTIVGYGNSQIDGRKVSTSAFYISLELYELKENDIVNTYINPIFNLSFFDKKEKTRDIKSKEIIKKIKKELEGLKKEYALKELSVFKRRWGIKTDIEIDLSTKNKKLLNENLDLLEKELGKIKGVKDLTRRLKEGKKEFVFTVNEYGKSLGLNDVSLSQIISSFFKNSKHTRTIINNNIVGVYTEIVNEVIKLQDLNIPISDGKFIRLGDVSYIETKINNDIIIKDNLKIIKSIYANVDYKETSSKEILKKLKPTIEQIEKNGVEVLYDGEEKQTRKLKSNLINALLISLLFIFITLLINFPSYRTCMIIISVIPLTLPGVFIGHFIMDLKLTVPSFIGAVGLIGVIINDGIIMLDFLQKTKSKEEFLKKAMIRIRPILITSITTLLGISTLIFFPTGQTQFLQPLGVSLGFGLFWGTILNLFYLPCAYSIIKKF